MTVYAITDTKKGRTGIAPTYLQTTQEILQQRLEKRSFKQIDKKLRHGLFSLFMITVSRLLSLILSNASCLSSQQ